MTIKDLGANCVSQSTGLTECVLNMWEQQTYVMVVPLHKRTHPVSSKLNGKWTVLHTTCHVHPYWWQGLQCKVPTCSLEGDYHSHTIGAAIWSNWGLSILPSGMWTGGAKNQTANLPIGGRPLYLLSYTYILFSPQLCCINKQSCMLDYVHENFFLQNWDIHLCATLMLEGGHQGEWWVYKT